MTSEVMKSLGRYVEGFDRGTLVAIKEVVGMWKELTRKCLSGHVGGYLCEPYKYLLFKLSREQIRGFLQQQSS